MEYLLRLLSNLFRSPVDHELEEFCYNLENRVKDLKRRIAEMQMVVGKRHDGKVEPTVRIVETPKPAPTPERPDINELKAKLMGRK